MAATPEQFARVSHPQSQSARQYSEQQLLQFLCVANASAFERGKVVHLLKGYKWIEPDHTILFECICELLAREPRKILEHLPAAVTRRGFPEISCDALAEHSQITTTEALAVAQELLRASQ